MIKVSIGNSVSEISGYSIQEYRQLRQLLSYTISDAKQHFGGFGSPVRYLIDKKGVFNTGLLPLVNEYIDKTGKQISLADFRIPPKRSQMPYNFKVKITPYLPQQEAVDRALKAPEGCGSIVMPTGSGKSITFALLIKSLGLKTLIVVPNLTLKTQLTETFTNLFTSLKGITIENISSSALKKKENYDLLIIDEMHHAAAATYQKLNRTNWNGIYHRFFFSATPKRNDPDEQMLLESITGQVIYNLSYQEAVDQQMIVPVSALVIDAPLNVISGSKWPSVYKELVVHNQSRNMTILLLMISMHKNKIPTLVLVKEVEHGRILSQDGSFAFACGEDKESKHNIDLFNSGKITVLIGTMGVIGEGVDTKPAEVVIIAGMGKSRPAMIQAVGRVLRKSRDKEIGTVILINDAKNHKWGKTHYNAQKATLKEVYGVAPTKITVDFAVND